MNISPRTVSNTVYTPFEKTGVAVIATAGALSIFAILVYVMTCRSWKTGALYIQLRAYFLSLLVANVIQSIGALINYRWVALGGVASGELCTAQGGIKNAGNIGTALWSFMLALHVFNLLFLRWETSKWTLALTLIFGWGLVALVPLVGLAAIETPSKGPYFDISGYWCWITNAYPLEQTLLEYLFEFVSTGLGFFLYTTILLRVRGNLARIDGRWKLRFVPRSERWRLAISRDSIDSSMVRMATQMVWYPVAYSILLIPVSLSRLSQFAGHAVPFWAVLISDVIFNLTGFVNVLLMFATRRLLPDDALLPQFSTPRKGMDLSSPEAAGITPFDLAEPIDPRPTRTWSQRTTDTTRSVARSLSVSSVDSQTPLNPHRH